MCFLKPIIPTFLLALWSGLPSAQAQACEERGSQDQKYIVCTLKPNEDGLRLFWKDTSGAPYRQFQKVADAVSKEGKVLAFAINAGMYQTDFTPMGLYTEEGREFHPADATKLVQTSGPLPNFYKKPNAVFYLGANGANIVSTDEFLKLRPSVRLATQSGPLLVIGNKLNPILIKGSTDRTRRSGVGICGDSTIRFAISEDAVNFYDFALFFRNELNCANALFLDGGGGAGIYDPASKRSDWSWHGGYGPIFGFVQ